MRQAPLKKSLSNEIYRSGDSDYMVSLARGLHVIQVFCEDGRRTLTTAEVTRLSGLSRTVVTRCLYTLQELGFIGRERRDFFLLPKVLKLGYGYVSTANLPTLAQPILNAMTDETHSASAVVVMDDDDVLYLARATPPSYRNIVTMTISIGHRRPAFATASGLVLLANLAADELKAYFARQDSAAILASDGVTLTDIERQVVKARVDDYALTKLSFLSSMRALAVPVKNVVNNVVASMALAVYDEASTDEQITARYLPQLRAGARSLSASLAE